MQTFRIALGFLVAACILAVHFPAGNAGSYSIEVTYIQKLYAPGKAFNGTVSILFDKVIPQDAQLMASVDGYSPSVLDVQPYVSGAMYQYKSYQFSYNLTANGKNQWYEYPDKSFYYRIRASGTCGDQQCASPPPTCDCAGLCGPPYPCAWSVTYNDMQAAVNADEGLKKIFDGSEVIYPPVSANSDTRWSQLLDTYNQYGVQTAMSMACGNMYYGGHLTDQNGWIKMTLQNLEQIPGSYWKKATLEPFEESSLTSGRQKFISASCSQPYVCGGIYKDSTLLASGTGYATNGTSGEVIIKDYNPFSVYTMVYLPPNGPYLCVYTSSKVSNSTTWIKNITESGSVSYDRPFSKTYTETQLPFVFNDLNKDFVDPPACPSNARECNQTITTYYAGMASDPTGGSIRISFNGQTRVVNATLSSPEIASRTITISLSDFTDLKAPSSVQEHTLSVSLQSSGSELASKEIKFNVCTDADHDGYCSIAGGGNDCNDSNPNIHPGARELCNGIDDNCNGLIDEDFRTEGRVLGTSCGKGVCTGTWVCSWDHKDVTCKTSVSPGPEICGNGLDDDCDGVVDEAYETDSRGNIAKVCGTECKDGDKEPCKKLGECSKNPGYRVCNKGKWGICIGGMQPTEEVCNGKDDDCNGIIDDVYGGKSVQETQCGCYGGAQPSEEKCDGIDNDCNDLIDEIQGCCTAGETKPCGSDEGTCRTGVQVCDNNGQWGTECKGGVRPNPDGEICYNGLDDDCDGEIDENCDPGFTCRNGKQELNEDGVDCGGPCPQGCGIPYNWILLAGGTILLIVALAILELKGRL